MTLTGHASTGKEVAFTCECTVGCEVTMPDAESRLTPDAMIQLYIPLATTAMERCHAMAWSMGYPATTRVPRFPVVLDPDAEKLAERTPGSKGGKRLGTGKKRSSAPKAGAD